MQISEDDEDEDVTHGEHLCGPDEQDDVRDEDDDL